MAARRRAKALLELVRRAVVGSEVVAGVAEVVKVREVVGRKAVDAGVRQGRLEMLTIDNLLMYSRLQMTRCNKM